MAAAAPTTQDEDASGATTFWDTLPTGHRVSLFALPFVILGGLAKWTVATFMHVSIASRGFETRTISGYEREGWIIAGLALFALLTLVLVKDRQKRASRALAASLVAFVFAVAELISGGLLFVMEPASESSLSWGLPLAAVAALVASVGALAGSRDPAQQPTY